MVADLIRQHIIKRLNGGNPEHLDQVLSGFQQVQLKKNQCLLSMGQVCDGVYYICSGLLQISYLDEAGNEWTRDIVQDDQWCCSLDSFINFAPSSESIRALENTVVLKLNKTDFDDLTSRVPGFVRVYQSIITEQLVNSNNRIKFLMTRDARSRIAWLYENRPDLIQRVSSRVLASFLHLHKDVYSRLRAATGKSGE